MRLRVPGSILLATLLSCCGHPGSPRYMFGLPEPALESTCKTPPGLVELSFAPQATGFSMTSSGYTTRQLAYRCRPEIVFEEHTQNPCYLPEQQLNFLFRFEDSQEEELQIPATQASAGVRSRDLFLSLEDYISIQCAFGYTGDRNPFFPEIKHGRMPVCNYVSADGQAHRLVDPLLGDLRQRAAQGGFQRVSNVKCFGHVLDVGQPGHEEECPNRWFGTRWEGEPEVCSQRRIWCEGTAHDRYPEQNCRYSFPT